MTSTIKLDTRVVYGIFIRSVLKGKICSVFLVIVFFKV